MATMNRQVTLASRPVGVPKLSDFHLISSPLPSPAAGEVLVRSVFLSLDPYMRGRMSDAASYAPPLAIGEVMTGGAVGIVVEGPRNLNSEPVMRSQGCWDGRNTPSPKGAS